MNLTTAGDTDLAPLGVIEGVELNETVFVHDMGRLDVGGELMVRTSAARATAWVVFTRHRLTCPGGVDEALCGCGSAPDGFHAYLAGPDVPGAVPLRPPAPTGPRRCKDCPPEVKPPRAAPHPGPRCATHHRERKKELKRRGHDSHIRALFSITIEEYDQLREAQGGLCAICGVATGATKRLAIDHDHATREIRGLLCFHCNKYLGWVRDNPEVFRRGVDYLLNPPARAVLGVRRTDDAYRNAAASDQDREAAA